MPGTLSHSSYAACLPTLTLHAYTSSTRTCIPTTHLQVIRVRLDGKGQATRRYFPPAKDLPLSKLPWETKQAPDRCVFGRVIAWVRGCEAKQQHDWYRGVLRGLPQGTKQAPVRCVWPCHRCKAQQQQR